MAVDDETPANKEARATEDTVMDQDKELEKTQASLEELQNREQKQDADDDLGGDAENRDGDGPNYGNM